MSSKESTPREVRLLILVASTITEGPSNPARLHAVEDVSILRGMMHIRALLVGVIALTPVAHAQSPPPLQWRECGATQVQVLLMGVFHMARDEAIIDVRSPRRQAELDTLIARLARFAPTKVAVERPLTSHDTLNALYRAFREQGGPPTNRNEVWQIGFRLARMLGHQRVYPVDFRLNLGNDSLSAFYRRHPEARERVNARSLEARRADSAAEDSLKGRSVLEILRWMNANAHLENATFFRDILPLGEGANYAGADMLTRWYERNLKIVHNLLRVLEPSDQRVVLVIGNGHVAPLKAILEATPQLCPVSALTVLDTG